MIRGIHTFLFLFFVFLFVCTAVFGQSRSIHGTLMTEEQQPVAYAGVTLIDSAGRVIAFDNSNSQGHFNVDLRSTSKQNDSLFLRVQHLGYRNVNIALRPEQNQYDILMKAQTIDLSEVQVKSRPRIASHGDTLTYDVGSFSKSEDRSIGDVLKRLPGMEVSDNGQITYNGRAISSFYIDGDDLLSDKYTIGTKTIPHAIVKGVEVVQNHQPLKVLKDKVMSDQIAVNLVIKEEAKLSMSGQAKLGAGLPHQYDGELNTILFNKKYKMLNVLKGNNVGVDLRPDFTSFNSSDQLTQLGNSRPGSLLSTGTVGDPPLLTGLHYFNNSGSLNANNLVNLKNGLQLKMNVNLLLDHNETTYENRSTIFLNHDTIHYTEQQDIHRNPFITEVSLTAKANEERYYFENELKLAYTGGREESYLVSNEVGMEQQLHHRVRDFSNTLNYTPALKNDHIINLSWYLNHYNSPQKLSIQPGINKDILNKGDEYAGLGQSAETPTWFNRISTDYRLTNTAIKQRYRVGVVNEWQHLKTSLRLQSLNGREERFYASGDNDLHWRRDRLFADASYEYRHGRFETTVNIPLAAQRIHYQDEGFELNEQKSRLIFNPSLRAKLMTTVEDYLSLNYAFSNQTGNINGVFRAAVLTNYRTLLANDAELQERQSHQVGLHYNFQRSINMLFMNAGIEYRKSIANTIASSQLTDDIARTVLLPYENDVSTWSANASISKYIFSLGATTSLNASWSTTRFNQYLNDELLPFNNSSFTLHPKTELRLWNRVTVRYDGVATWIDSKLMQKETTVELSDRAIRQLRQSLGLSYSPSKAAYLRLDGRHYFMSQPGLTDVSYFFLSANMRYTIAKWRTDVELDIHNIADITAYKTYSLSANHFRFNHYQLRGRMVILKFVFNL